MKADLREFFRACNPSKVLKIDDAKDQLYYIDCAEIRGAEIIEELGKTIALMSPDSTCQLFTGHIGSGKSTELLRLKIDLERQGFHVVYFESSQDLDMGDVDISDILLAIALRISKSLESSKINLQGGYFRNLLRECIEFLQTPMELEVEAELSLGIGKLTAKTKESPRLRSQLRQFLEPQTENLLKAINQELLGQATQKELEKRGKEGLVVLIDNLDRVDNRPIASGQSLPEYLFVSRGEQLSRLQCHVVYTVPLVLMFSNEREALKNRLGGGTSPMVLPMVPVKLRDGNDCTQGLELLRQMILARAFPTIAEEERLHLVTEIFDSLATLDRLCRVSGGHVRNLLSLVYTCLRKVKALPITRDRLEIAIREAGNELTLAIRPDEWDLLRKVAQSKKVTGEQEYQILLRSLFVFEYRNNEGEVWFDINPLLAEMSELMKVD